MESYHLKNERRRRLGEKEKIKEKINLYCQEVFGIEDFFSLVEEFIFSKLFFAEDKLCLVLSRQVPTPNVEHLAFFLAAKEFGCHPICFSFVRDSFPHREKNEYKKSLISIPWIFRSRSGNLVVKREKIALEKDLQGAIFSQISAKNGKKLPEFHRQIFAEFNINPLILDLSKFFASLLLNSKKNLPDKVYLALGNKERPYDFWSVSGEINFENYFPRPPANWYYFFYLLLFADGRLGLVSTVDKDPEVISWFEKNERRIEEICGFKPLILNSPLEIDVPGLHSKLNEVPVIEDKKDFFGEVMKAARQYGCQSFYHFTRKIEETILLNL